MYIVEKDLEMYGEIELDIDYLKRCLRLTPEERFIKCAEFSDFCRSFNQRFDSVLENDHPEAYCLE